MFQDDHVIWLARTMRELEVKAERRLRERRLQEQVGEAFCDNIGDDNGSS